MTTVVFNETTEAKRMLEFLKTQRFAKIIDEGTPNASLMKSMEEARTGKTHKYKSTEDLFIKLRKKANV